MTPSPRHDDRVGTFRAMLLVVLAAIGCYGGPPMGDLSGTVTLDGEPIVTGTIHFEPADGKGPTASEVVKDGRYALRLIAHRYRVKISAPDMTPPSGPMPSTGYVPAEIVPPRYNAQTELSVEVARGANTADFALTRR